MKKTFIYMFALVTMLGFIASCGDWTDTEIKNPTDLTHTNKSEAYYKQLREYKKSDHEVAFGWFGNWVGAGLSLENTLQGLPDSVDFVSIWGNAFNLSAERKADLKQVQEVKGTRALLCFIVDNIGTQLTPAGEDPADFWGYKTAADASAEEVAAAKEKAIRKYANALCDSIDKYGYDGFDWDYEPHYGSPGNIAGQAEAEAIFIDEMSKRIGPKSGTGRLFVIDGEPQSVNSNYGRYFDYFIVQAYSCGSYADLDSRLNSTVNNFARAENDDDKLTAEEVAKKYIVTENFENYAKAGGVTHTTRDGRKVPSLIGMAEWKPIIDGKTVQKGGCGSYHMEYEYSVSGKSVTYPWLRQSIQIQNPSVKERCLQLNKKH